uniref:Uncharacterized protein n=1 Tax=Acrobeloides nanus TaxID=290746 RepID=A0A914DXZ9_9BILA
MAKLKKFLGFIGNGMDCSIRISCKVDPSICHKEAACQLDGRCVCKKGLVGDGMDCRTIVSAIDQQASPTISPTIRFECPTDCSSNSECVNGACKCVAGYKFDKDSNCVDIDECDMGIANCHSVATCTNLNGSYQCKCPEGYGGDGKDCYQYDQILPGIKIQCLADGMRLILAEEHVPFEGRVFVRGQTDNPYCSKTFSPLKQTEDPPTFHIPIAQCDMQLEENDTLATTVVIQKHAVFITEKAYAYRLRCQYPTAVKKMMTHFNVSELTTESIYEHGGDPVCSLTVTNENNLTIDSATVGQILKLQLSVLPNKTYSILPRNCFAINLETGEKYSLTDAAGCAIDTMLFPEWTRVRQDMTEAVFRTFKWPDSSMIRFECDCSACIGMCPTVNCGRRRDALFKRRFRARFARAGGVSPEINDTIPESGLVEEFIDEDLSWLKNIAVGNSSKLAFSSVVLVNEDEEEQLAQRQLERWLAQGSNYEAGVLQEPSIEEQVCIRPMWLAICLLSLLISGSMLTSMYTPYQCPRIDEGHSYFFTNITGRKERICAWMYFYDECREEATIMFNQNISQLRHPYYKNIESIFVLSDCIFKGYTGNNYTGLGVHRFQAGYFDLGQHRNRLASVQCYCLKNETLPEEEYIQTSSCSGAINWLLVSFAFLILVVIFAAISWAMINKRDYVVSLIDRLPYHRKTSPVIYKNESTNRLILNSI